MSGARAGGRGPGELGGLEGTMGTVKSSHYIRQSGSVLRGPLLRRSDDRRVRLPAGRWNVDLRRSFRWGTSLLRRPNDGPVRMSAGRWRVGRGSRWWTSLPRAAPMSAGRRSRRTRERSVPAIPPLAQSSAGAAFGERLERSWRRTWAERRARNNADRSSLRAALSGRARGLHCTSSTSWTSYSSVPARGFEPR
jgi:hypothetical protein